MRIEVLTVVCGVSWPVASTILHYCVSDDYPILDFRALWSLEMDANGLRLSRLGCVMRTFASADGSLPRRA